MLSIGYKICNHPMYLCYLLTTLLPVCEPTGAGTLAVSSLIHSRITSTQPVWHREVILRVG